MKKTLTVNLNNIVFHIDDDAYEMLQTYLHEIANHFQLDEEKTEIMNDIEARIAELFSEKLQKSKNVVNLDNVQEIIEIMGKPSQYAGEDEEQDNSTAPKSEKKQQSRRFYRDPENAILGGIGGGLAAYFGVDVTIVRVILAILAIASSGTFIPVYIIMWFVAPVAVTASQRLEMQGEDVTIDSIKTELNNAKSYVESEKFKDTASTVGNKVFSLIRILAKILLGFIGAILGVVGVVLVVALICLLFFLIFEPSFINNIAPGIVSNWGTVTPENLILIFISLILVIGCPIFMLIYWGIRVASGKYDGSKTASIVVLILWIAGLFMFYSVGANAFIQLNKSDRPMFSSSNNDTSNEKMETRVCDPFTEIEISGNIDLTIQKDSIQSVTVSCNDDLLQKVITKVENGKLKIYTENVFFDHNKIKISISTNDLKSIVAKGACEIRTSSIFTAQDLNIQLYGASNLDIDLDITGVLNVELAGASEADLSGNCQTFKLRAIGASEIRAKDLKSKNVEVYAAGASSATVFASESFDAQAYGASDIDCKGNPKTIKQKDGGASSILIE